MNLSEMKHVLTARHIQLTRSLGQSFLHDGNQLRRIVAGAELSKSDRILEIGPGLGPLTELLVAEASEVFAIEKDRRLVEFLRERFASDVALVSHSEISSSRAKLKLLEGDALEFLRRDQRDWSSWKLVSNLPYSVASPILVELAQATNGPQRIVVTLQNEVARRLMATPGVKDYGVLTLLIQLNYEALTFFKIPAGCFFPEPEVDSACVILRRRPQPLLPADFRPLFSKIVKRSFSQRRKMMLKLLRADWPVKALEGAFSSVGLQPQVRAEALSLEQFVRLTQLLAPNSSHGGNL